MSWKDEKGYEERKVKERDEVLLKASAIIEAAEKDNRSPTAEEDEKFKQYHDEAADILVDMNRCKMQRDAEELEIGREPLDLPKETRKQYSILRCIRMIKAGKSLSGLEGEVDKEMEKFYGRPAQGIWTPFLSGGEKFALDSTTGSGTIPSTLDTANFIDLLRNKTVTQNAGAKIITGITGGTWSISKRTAASVAYWVTQGSAPSASDGTIDQVDFTPKTMGVSVTITRKHMIQTSMDSEQLVRDDLAQVIAIELDRAALNGSGSGAEPEGILQNSSVNVVEFGDGTNGGKPLYSKLVQLETEVAVDNADLGKLAYVTTAQGRGYLKSTDKAYVDSTNQGATGRMMWADDNSINGFNAYATQQMPADGTTGSDTECSSMIFANWNDLVFAFWTGVDLIIDPYTSRAGSVTVTALYDLDIQRRHDESFCKVVDFVTS